MDIQTIKSALEERARAVEAGRALTNETQGREPTAEERAKAEQIDADIARLDDIIKRGLNALESDKVADEARAKVEALVARAETRGEEARESDLDKLRKIGTGELRGAEFRPTPDEVRDLAKGQANPPTSNGTVNIVRTLYGELFEALRELSTVMVGNATILRTETGEDIVYPKVAGYSTAQIVGEATSVPKSDPAFGPHITLKAYKYGLRIDVSSELIQDAFFDLVGFLARQAGEAMGEGMGAHFLTGTGSGQPKGLLTDATAGKELATAGTLGFEDLIDVEHSLTRPYRNGAVWLFHDSTVAALRKIKDSTDNFVWQPSVQVGKPDLLLGRPVLTDPNVPVLDDTAEATVGAIANIPRAYVVRFASALRVDRSEHVAFDTDEVAFRFLQRADGQRKDDNAVRLIVNPEA